jgi:multimeric flavodoxin WrbA
MKKVVAVLGSPRKKSNSTALAGIVLDEAKKLGAKTEEFRLNKMKYKGCQACEACKKKLDHCVLDDDLTEVLEAVKQADVVILTSPIYFSEVSGQFKQFFDRTYSYLNPDFTCRLAAGKKSLFIQAQGQPDAGLYGDVYKRHEIWLTRYGFTDNEVLVMNGPRDEDSAAQRPDLESQARDLAKKLLG